VAGALLLQGLPEAGIEKPTAIYQKRKTMTRNKHFFVPKEFGCK
jgi:hypothetical protein